MMISNHWLQTSQCRSKNDHDTTDNDDDADNENNDNEKNDNDYNDDDYRPREGSSVRETASFQTGRSPTMFTPVLGRSTLNWHHHHKSSS